MLSSSDKDVTQADEEELVRRESRDTSGLRTAARWLAAAGVAAGLAVSSTPVATAAPAPAIVSPTAPVAGAPGDLLSYKQIMPKLIPWVPLDVQAWQISYVSTDATGDPIQVTGQLLVPTAPYPGERPLIGYAVGTQGMADRCAASTMMSAGLEYEAPGIGALLARGWAVVATDYPGLGSSGLHPYNIGRALGPSVLDSIRAARHFAPAGLALDGPLALVGYSEGGGAAGWAAQLQPSYAPELRLTGVAVGAVPADLEAEFHYLDNGLETGLLLWGAMGLAQEYPELDLEAILNPAGKHWAWELRDSCLFPEWTLNALEHLGGHVDDYVTTNPLRDPAWLARIRENKLGASAPAAPVLLANAEFDEAVPVGTAHALADAWQAGTSVEFRSLGPLEHVTGMPVFWLSAADWLGQRFAHQ
ncbi:lipase family protein [Nocardia sp. NPDC051030]|uniref:lipase family protein n=1 Tax=Nocardia sp. NPDC051030 TaxID=3155162 RepID=UPI003429A602